MWWNLQSAILSLSDDTISKNGGGIVVRNGGFLALTGISSTTQSSNNAGHGVFAFSHGTVRLVAENITGNGGDGIRVQDGSVLRPDFVAPIINNITGNAGAGVNLGDLSLNLQRVDSNR